MEKVLVHTQKLNFPFVHIDFKNDFMDTKMLAICFSRK